MYVRYEIKSNEEILNGAGILTAVDDLFDSVDEIIRYIAYFEDHLHLPDDIDMRDTISYFTQKGNRKFKKSIMRLCKGINATGRGEVIEIRRESIPLECIYQDEHQAIFRRAS